MATEYFYGGKLYSLDPKYVNPIGYGTFSQISSATDPRTANQVKEVSEHLNTGVKNIEVGNVGPDVFESIPKQHFEEMRRLAKLTGAKLSMHSPMIDPTGITEHGWDKMTQQSAEDQLWSSIQKSRDLNPEGTIVTFHASSVGLPPAEYSVKEGGKEKMKSILLINSSNGKIHQIKEEERYFPTGKEGEEIGKPIPFDPIVETRRLNEEEWMGRLSNLNFYAQRGEEVVESALLAKEKYGDLLKDLSKEDIDKLKERPDWADLKRIQSNLNHGKIFLRDSYRNLREMYDQVYKSTTGTVDQEKLKDFAVKIQPYVKDLETTEKDPERLKEFADLIEKGVNIMGEIRKPEIIKPLKQFAIEKAGETTANLAYKAYRNFGDQAPIIALENHPAKMSLLTTGEELRDVIKEAHKDFIEKAVKDGVSPAEAKKQAERLIGATWDVGHINMMRRFGYDKNDIIDETEKVAPYVKKVHLSDNFGFEHTELPMGMGNVPMKEILDELKKGKEGFEAKKVIEAGNWWQHFSPGGKVNSPLIPTLQGMGVPMYTGAPNWGQMYSAPGGYFSGYGTMLPDQNFQMYGAGFSSLPMELGGQMQTKDSRFSGTPMS